jgi:hypothetical protein
LLGHARIDDGEIMSAIPDRLDALLTRDATAAALTEAGYPVRPKTLATMATRGGGPPFQKFSTRPLYPWVFALAWAKSRLGPIVISTSELDALTPGWRRPRSEINAAAQNQPVIELVKAAHPGVPDSGREA